MKIVRRLIEDRERRIAKKYHSSISEIYKRYLEDFIFTHAGTALTLFRDNKFGDTDWDFGIYEEDLPKLDNFLKMNILKFDRTYKYDGVPTEIKAKYKKINVDFFVFRKWPDGRYRTVTVWENHNDKPNKIWIWDNVGAEKLKMIIINGFKVPSSKSFYLYKYGKNWDKKIKYTFDFRNDESYINTVKRVVKSDSKTLELCEIIKGK